jgi:hypothetical protein
MAPLSGSLKYHSEAFEVCGYVCVRMWAGRNFSSFFYILLGFFCIHIFFRHCISEKNVRDKQYKTFKNTYNKYGIKNLTGEKKYTGMRQNQGYTSFVLVINFDCLSK